MATKPFPSQYIPSAEEQCICGKNKTFSQCCGSSKSKRKPPVGLVLKRGLVKSTLCDKLVAIASQNTAAKLGVAHKPDAEIRSYSKERESSLVDMAGKQELIVKLVEKIYAEIVPSEMHCQTKEFSFPALMRYEPGGYYKKHADAEVYNPSTQLWERKVERDISLLIYLNDDYEGGKLHFNYFNYTFSPRKGDLVLFPSDHRYMHEAQMVKEGVRYVIVSWATIKRS